MPSWKKVIISGSDAALNSLTVTNGVTITGSITALNQTASFGYVSASFVDITGKQTVRGYTQYIPTSDVVPISVPGGYIYSSGSQGDLYFAQTNGSVANVVRLRWLEGNMYSGLLNGALISTASSTIYNVSSGSGIIVSMGASTSTEPYPTVQYISWDNLSASIAPLSASYDQSFIAIEPTGSVGKIYTQGTPYNDGQYNTLIPIGVVLHQNHSTINGVQTFPSVAYGWKQRSNDFIRAFGALKLSGFSINTSGSTGAGVLVGGGTAWADGRNYTNDPNNPSYIIDSGLTTSKVFRYRQSGSDWIYDTNGGAGYTTLDQDYYNNPTTGVLTALTNGQWAIQRLYFFPNSVSKAVYAYYGNAFYTSEAEARANIEFESFVEAPNTAASAIYLGAIIFKGDFQNWTQTDRFGIYNGGLFRNVGGSGGGGSVVTSRLVDLSDVSITGPTNGQPLVYNNISLKWENASSITANVIGTASFATTASYVNGNIFTNSNPATSASYALSSSYTTRALSSSYALTSSYSTNISGSTNYVSKFTGANTLGNSLIYDNGTNVGIGTTAPKSTLQLGSAYPTLLNFDTNNGSYLGSNFYYSSGWKRVIGSNATAISFQDGTTFFQTSDWGAADSAISWANTVAITGGGDVGIGTTSPGYKLHVVGNSFFHSDFSSYTADGLFSTNALPGVRTRTPGGTSQGVRLGYRDFGGGQYWGRLGIAGAVNWSAGIANSDGTNFSIGLNNTTTTDYVTVVSGSGNVGIGTATPASKLSVLGSVQVADDTSTAASTNVGSLRYRTSGSNSYTDMVMQTGASTYAWVNIVQNSW